jgi:hypothetical protein
MKDANVFSAWPTSKRSLWEALYEVTQIKGDGESHSLLSPDDEFADHETWDVGNLDLSVAKTHEMLAGEYAREALKRGLEIEALLGTNPYKFGQIAATDSHTSLATAQEDKLFGKRTGREPSTERMNHPTMKTDKAIIIPAFAGYKKGVPMGADLPKRSGSKVPTFMVFALRDPIAANLDRIQIVKGWLDADGKTHEKVYDVAWSGDRTPGKDGRLPAVCNAVDAAAANFTNTIGASELAAVWTDPDFKPLQKVFYYARVIEIPTPRWSTYDAFRFGIPIPKGAPV